MATPGGEEELGLQCSKVFTERNLKKNMDNKGTFKSALTQSFKGIKETKAAAITEDVELSYRRKIEDLCRSARQCDRDREDILINLAPSNITSLSVVPSDFKADDFLEQDLKIGLNKRDTLIKLEIAVQRYEYLFGEYDNMSAVLKYLPDYKSTVNNKEE